MEFEISDTPIRFHLFGNVSAVEDNCYGDVGLRLMNEMWKSVKESHTATAGINHWVYLPEGRLFVGVELLKISQAPDTLEPLEFELQRYLKHVHFGPYQALPERWNALKTELAACGETVGSLIGFHAVPISQSASRR